MRYTDATSINKAISLVGSAAIDVASGSSPFLSIFNFAKKGLTKAQRKKLARRRYRMFVDNIIMHHKRIHDRNREIAVNNAKALTKKEKPREGKPRTVISPRRSQNKWRGKFDSRQNISLVRERIASRRMRAESRWKTIISQRREGTASEIAAVIGR